MIETISNLFGLFFSFVLLASTALGITSTLFFADVIPGKCFVQNRTEPELWVDRSNFIDAVIIILCLLSIAPASHLLYVLRQHGREKLRECVNSAVLMFFVQLKITLWFLVFSSSSSNFKCDKSYLDYFKAGVLILFVVHYGFALLACVALLQLTKDPEKELSEPLITEKGVQALMMTRI